jgi:hypothetical protein
VSGGQHDAAHVIVVASRREGRDQVGQQLGRERVPRIGLIQGDRGDVVVDAVQQRVELGQGALLGSGLGLW